MLSLSYEVTSGGEMSRPAAGAAGPSTANPYVDVGSTPAMDVTREFSGPQVLGLVGAAVATVAAFLPWVTAAIDAGPIGSAVVATGIEGIGVLTLLLAAIAGLVILIPEMGSDGPVASGLAGMAVAIVGIRVIIALPAPASPGTGLYLTVAGGLALVIGGLLDFASRSGPETPTEAPQ